MGQEGQFWLSSTPHPAVAAPFSPWVPIPVWQHQARRGPRGESQLSVAPSVVSRTQSPGTASQGVFSASTCTHKHAHGCTYMHTHVHARARMMCATAPMRAHVQKCARTCTNAHTRAQIYTNAHTSAQNHTPAHPQGQAGHSRAMGVPGVCQPSAPLHAGGRQLRGAAGRSRAAGLRAAMPAQGSASG